jgi:1-acyl-sn-glycerol-3-phosphate acyltransferase
MFDPMFVAPRHNAALLSLSNLLLPRVAHFFGNVYDVNVPPEDFAQLAALRDSRALLCPNHPTETDPIVVFWLARMLGQPFNYLATRETLDGPRGRLLNQIGVYSVIRGFPDRESLRMTRRLLAELDRKVVIFPEGQIYERNEMLLTFHSGVAQMGFWALDDLQKAGKALSLPLLPLAVKYRCHAPPGPTIEKGLRDLERALGLETKTELGDYERLRRAGGQVLANLEREEGVTPEPGAGLSERIIAVRRKVFDRVAHAAGTTVDHAAPPADQLHGLYNELKAWVGVLGPEHTEYDEERYRHRLRVAAPLFQELLRLQNFIAMTGDYVAARPTAERFLEVLNCLQLEVLGRVRHRAPLEAHVRIATPFRLEQQYDDYRKRKREVVTETTRRLQETIEGLLQSGAGEGTPISLTGRACGE